MGWLQRLFGQEKNEQPAAKAAAAVPATDIPPERVGLNGEFDQSGLAKRVAAAFDEDPAIDDINTLYVAQTSGTVVLKGKVPNQAILTKMIAVAKGVSGTTAVDSSQVDIG
ncbi:MAG: BON domain-containing protein [Anaerolineae bacterium]|nr:BON domain-containing protein [Gloeobacterales cyanobacterium ES-bin-313]